MPKKSRVSPMLLVLREIRDEVRGTNRRVDALTARVERVEEGVGAVEQRLVGVEIRLATELVAVAEAVRSVQQLIVARSARADDHERRIAALERRTG